MSSQQGRDGGHDVAAGTPTPRRGFAGVAVGDRLPDVAVEVSRRDLVAYAAASGDHNPIHWSERAADDAGLPGVVAHGMWTMGAASRVLTAWAGDPAAVLACSCRFTRPVPVPEEGTARLAVGGTVRALDPDARTAEVTLDVTLGGSAVLGKARATVQLR